VRLLLNPVVFAAMAFKVAMVFSVCVILLFTVGVDDNAVVQSNTAKLFLNTVTLNDGENAEVNAADPEIILETVIDAVVVLVNTTEVCLPTVMIADSVTAVDKAAAASVAEPILVASQVKVKLLEGAAAASAV
jgi:hypothetical protein